MLSAFKDEDPLSNPLLLLSLQRDTATLPSRVAPIISGIGSTVAWVIELPPPLPPPLCRPPSSAAAATTTAAAAAALLPPLPH